MTKAQVILCERGAAWAAAVAGQLPPDVRLRQTRAVGECVSVLAEAPTSLLAVELTSQNLARVLATMDEVSRKFPQARVVVLAQRGLEGYEWLLREAGALHFTASPRELAGFEALARRHFERVPGPPTATLAAQVWDALPWNDVATA
jgi:hypothetical protein